MTSGVVYTTLDYLVDRRMTIAAGASALHHARLQVSADLAAYIAANANDKYSSCFALAMKTTAVSAPLPWQCPIQKYGY